jgi:mRNA interferase YafQ
MKSNKRFKVKTFEYIIEKLKTRKVLEEKYKDHQLKGDMSNLRECHIAPDILLIYEILDQELILHLIDIGSHSKIF